MKKSSTLARRERVSRELGAGTISSEMLCAHCQHQPGQALRIVGLRRFWFSKQGSGLLFFSLKISLKMMQSQITMGICILILKQQVNLTGKGITSLLSLVFLFFILPFEKARLTYFSTI